MAKPAHTMDVSPLPPGGGFLLSPVGQERIRTPQDFTEDQRAFFRTAEKFAQERILAHAALIEKKDYALVRQLLCEAGELGLLGLDVPEAYGGLAQDLTSSMLVTEAMAKLGSWSVTFGAQVGIGSLPIVYFGTEAQKRKYLPKLVSGEWVAAYALSESSSGSDALGATTKAVLSHDRSHFVLNGAKQWISNAGFADVFIVFAKIDGEHFSAFIVERGTPGFSLGAEEHKMGIRGSSTCPLVFEDARVPVENLLGEPGKGYKIAIETLNEGRIGIGAQMLGLAEGAWGHAARYAQQRRQFGKTLAEFQAVQFALAQMATEIEAARLMVYNAARLKDAGQPFVREAAMCKLYASQVAERVASQCVEIFGGNGFVRDYPAEKYFRDSKVGKIYEGTSNMQLATIAKQVLKGSGQ